MLRLRGPLLLVPLVLLVGTAKGDEPPPSTAADIERLVRQLGSGNFREREAASRALGVLGDRVLPALQRALRSKDAEIRRRAAELVDAGLGRERRRAVASLQGFWVLKTTEYRGMKADQDPTESEIERLLHVRGRMPEERELPVDLSHYRRTIEFKAALSVTSSAAPLARPQVQ